MEKFKGVPYGLFLGPKVCSCMTHVVLPVALLVSSFILALQVVMVIFTRLQIRTPIYLRYVSLCE